MYKLILAKWIAGKLSEDDVDLLVKTGWLTVTQGETIKSTAKS